MALPQIEPKLNMPMSEAMQRLTGYEMLKIKKQLKRTSIADGDPIETMYAVMWAFENRNAPTTWDSVMALEMHEVQGYFQPEPADPDGEAGE